MMTMNPGGQLLFRPSIIITLGKAGDQIREYLSPYPNPVAARDGSGRFKRLAEGPESVYHLLAGVDPLLHNSIALLHVIPEFVKDKNGKEVGFLTAIPIPLAGRDFSPDVHIPKQPGPFREVFLDSLVSVQSESRTENVLKQYSVPDTRTQVYIVGEEDEYTIPWLAKVLESIRRATPEPKFHFEPMVCYLLNCYDVEDDYSATLLKPRTRPGPKWAQHHLPNFSYLYEPIITRPQPVFLFRDEMHYVTAQTLLTLVSTGITSWEEFKEHLKLDLPQLENYADHVGSFSTGMIQFPRPAALHYCSASLVNELMQDWRASYLKSNVTQEEHYALKNQARSVILSMRQWIMDSEERPGATESLWPSLDIIRRNNPALSKNDLVAQQEIYARLRELTARLFDSLSEENIGEAFANQTRKSWEELADEHKNGALSLISAWADQSRQAWNYAIEDQKTEITRIIYDMCEKENNGFEYARIFIDELDNRLKDLRQWLDDLQKAHRVAYDNYLEMITKKLKGEWHSPDQLSSIIDDDIPNVLQLKPTMSGQAPLGGGAGPMHLPPPAEQEIEFRLKKKVIFKQGLVPKVGTLFGAGLLGFLASAFLAMPFNLPSLPVNGGLAFVIAMGNFILYVQRYRDLHKCRRQLLNFYQRYFAYMCERFEDERRSELLGQISQGVGEMRKRLDRFAEFCEEHANNALGETENVTHQLFDGPAGRRDVFVADGERLDRTGPFTLRNVADKVSYNRLQHSREEWHRSLNEMRRELFARLRAKNRNMLAMDAAELQQELYDFMAEVVDGYLTGSWVSIGAALDKPEIWAEVLRRAGRSMYFAGVGLLEPEHIFVCGRTVDLVKGRGLIPVDAILMPTNCEERLLVAAFYRGGQPTKLNADKLFMLKN